MPYRSRIGQLSFLIVSDSFELRWVSWPLSLLRVLGLSAFASFSGVRATNQNPALTEFIHQAITEHLWYAGTERLQSKLKASIVKKHCF